VNPSSNLMTDIHPPPVDAATSARALEASLEAGGDPLSGARVPHAGAAVPREQPCDEVNLCTRCLHRSPVSGGKTCLVCREASRRYSKRHWDSLRPEKRAERASAARRRQKAAPAKTREYQRRSRDKKKREAFRRLGDACACCGERTFEFLQLHHLDGGGNEHRRAVGNGSAYWNAFSSDHEVENIEVLCANCHLAVTRVGSCPHQRTDASRWVDPLPGDGIQEELQFLSTPAQQAARLPEGLTHAC
jgi:hypothetical protein